MKLEIAGDLPVFSTEDRKAYFFARLLKPSKIWRPTEHHGGRGRVAILVDGDDYPELFPHLDIGGEEGA